MTILSVLPHPHFIAVVTTSSLQLHNAAGWIQASGDNKWGGGCGGVVGRVELCYMLLFWLLLSKRKKIAVCMSHCVVGPRKKGGGL